MFRNLQKQNILKKKNKIIELVFVEKEKLPHYKNLHLVKIWDILPQPINFMLSFVMVE